ncbi:MAG TPA: hypothetical protein VF021_04805 [Longimicrobiales bacterium]
MLDFPGQTSGIVHIPASVVGRSAMSRGNMTQNKAAPAALSELQSFAEFLKSMWSILAGLSAVFPLSNLLIDAVPVKSWPDGGFTYLPGGVISAVATICCVFVVFWTFGQRALASSWTRTFVHRRAWRSFVLGVAALVSYLAVYLAITNDFYWSVLGWQSSDLRRMLGDVLLLLLYATSFALVTRAFIILGLFEFVSSRD